ncbi:MAG: FMN-binding protein [Oscillospiraceae bacterium]|nr:FMN-binding protein [Oscillospiraceae bacterium]MBQ9696673.1 FMN-binding protein [Oscillospiraceae bacterium]MBR1897345.1 FMN-binding protein [Oscillospiraceae bacterium]
MKRRSAIAFAAVLALALTGCGAKTYADGTYTAQSQEYVNDDEDETAGNGYGVVTLTITDGKISACEFKTYELDGTEKDEDYGKENGEVANKDFYNKAQKALAACDKYAQALVDAGDLSGVDAISGATVNYNEFREAVGEALKQAQQQ